MKQGDIVWFIWGEEPVQGEIELILLGTATNFLALIKFSFRGGLFHEYFKDKSKLYLSEDELLEAYL